MSCPRTQHRNNAPILTGEENENPAPSGIKNYMAASDNDKAPRSNNCATSLSTVCTVTFFFAISYVGFYSTYIGLSTFREEMKINELKLNPDKK